MENFGRVVARRHEEYAQERRDTMLNATLRVFAQSGFAEAKIDQIAAAADLSKASLHLFDPSKGSLMHSLLERYAVLPELPKMMASLGDAPPALGMPTLIAEVWRLLRQRKELAHVISREIQCSAESGAMFAEQLGPSSYQAACRLSRPLDEPRSLETPESARGGAVHDRNAVVLSPHRGTDIGKRPPCTVGRNRRYLSGADFSRRSREDR